MIRHISSIVLLLILTFCYSCKKEQTNDPISYATVAGDYEWFYSDGQDFGESISFDNHSDQYGIRITESGELIFFKNGDFIQSESISNVNENEDYFYIYKEPDQSLILKYGNEQLISYSFPFANHVNEFNRIP